MAKDRSRAASPPRQDVAAIKLTDERYKTARALIKWAGIATVAWQCQLAISGLSGQTTNVALSLILDAVADIKFAATLSLAGGAAAWAILERKLRQRSIVRLHQRIKHLELGINPSRSSSKLTLQGATNPRDKGI